MARQSADSWHEIDDFPPSCEPGSQPEINVTSADPEFVKYIERAHSSGAEVSTDLLIKAGIVVENAQE